MKKNRIYCAEVDRKINVKDCYDSKNSSDCQACEEKPSHKIDKARKAKKKVIKKARRDEPFSEATPKFVFDYTNDTSRKALKRFCNELLKSEYNNDEALRLLVQYYLDELGKWNQEKAITSFWQQVSKMTQGDDSYLNEEQFKILEKAFLGDVKAIQKLIKANPEVIRLPFIASGLIKILNAYKHDIKLDANIRKEWIALLPSRDRNVSPLSEDILELGISKVKRNSTYSVASTHFRMP